MGNIRVLILGIGMVCLGAFGVYNAINDFGKAPEEKRDVTTTGTVTHLSATELRHALAGTLDTTYHMDFSFVAEDGQTHTGEHSNISEAHFLALHEGQEITVKYHSDQPSINGAPAYGTYVPVSAMPDATPQFRLYFCLGFAALGGLIVFYAVWFNDEPAGNYAVNA